MGISKTTEVEDLVNGLLYSDLQDTACLQWWQQNEAAYLAKGPAGKALVALARGEYGTHHQRKFWLYLGIARWGGVLSFKSILFNQVSHSSCNIDSSGKAFQCSRVDYGGKAEQIVSKIC